MDKKKATEAAQNFELNLNDNSAATQRARVISALRLAPTTTLEFRARWGVLMPASRIFELNQRGWDIGKVTVRADTEDGVTHRGIARYHLRREPVAANEGATTSDRAANDANATVEL